MYEYQVILKTQDDETLNITKIEEIGLTQKWSEMIQRIELRADYTMTLQKRFIDTDPDLLWLEIWK